MDAYNYPIFPQDMDGPLFARFPEVVKVGQAAPDGELTRLSDGRRVRLSEYWDRRYLVIEFGSLT